MSMFRARSRLVHILWTYASALLASSAPCVLPQAQAQTPEGGNDAMWDTRSDTWVATDSLGRQLPTFEEVGPLRKDRYVGLFYFLWLGAHRNGGPYDITQILAQDPEAMEKKDSPLWGPMHAPIIGGNPCSGTIVPMTTTSCASTPRCFQTSGWMWSFSMSPISSLIGMNTWRSCASSLESAPAAARPLRWRSCVPSGIPQRS